MNASLGHRVAAEVIGTGVLVAVVVGSGIQATELSHDVGMQLLANSLATVFGLGVLILLLGPVSGAHFNPAVSLAAWFTGRRTLDGFPLRDVAAYVAAQITGAIGRAILADAMFARPLVNFSTHDRAASKRPSRSPWLTPPPFSQSASQQDNYAERLPPIKGSLPGCRCLLEVSGVVT